MDNSCSAGLGEVSRMPGKQRGRRAGMQLCAWTNEEKTAEGHNGDQAWLLIRGSGRHLVEQTGNLLKARERSKEVQRS